MKWPLQAIAIAALGALWAETIGALIALPATVPTSFGTSGVPQAYGSKFTLLILPLVALGAFFITQLAQNGPMRVTGLDVPPERQADVDAVGRRFMALVRAELIVGFAAIQFVLIQSAHAQMLSIFFGVAIAAFPIVLISTVMVMIVRIVNVARR